jgi:hypothetical protein
MIRAALLTAAACLPLLLCLDAAGQGTPPPAGEKTTAGEPAPGGEQAIYRYLNAKGRPVYVNDQARIPPRYRGKARTVDLSAVSLNKELATEIEDQVKLYEERKEAQEAARKARAGKEGQGKDWSALRSKDGRPVLRLHESPPPQRSGAAAWFGRLWRNYDYLIVIAAALLLLLAFTPYMIRRIDPDRWVRVLMIALPVLASLGLMTYAMTRTTQMGTELRAGVADLSPGEVAPGDKQGKEFVTDDDGWINRRAPVKASAEAPGKGTIRGLRQLLRRLDVQRKQIERESR